MRSFSKPKSKRPGYPPSASNAFVCPSFETRPAIPQFASIPPLGAPRPYLLIALLILGNEHSRGRRAVFRLAEGPSRCLASKLLRQVHRTSRIDNPQQPCNLVASPVRLCHEARSLPESGGELHLRDLVYMPRMSSIDIFMVTNVAGLPIYQVGGSEPSSQLSGHARGNIK